MPKVAVPEDIRINPAFVIVKLPVLKVPPVMSNPAVFGILSPELGLIAKLPPIGIVINPPVNVKLPPLDILVEPLIVINVERFPLSIINSSKVVVPEIVTLPTPVN